MSALITDEEELEFQRKIKVKRRFRGLLIVVNMFLACYLIFAAGSAIVELIDNKNQSKDTVLLCGTREGSSIKIYNEYVKESIDGDFAIYGESLHLRQSNYDIRKNDAFENVQLVNVCSKNGEIFSSYKYNTHGEYLNTGINLFEDKNGKTLDEGYYVFYSGYVNVNNRGKVIKVNTDEKIEHVIYSTPNQNGKRTKATIFSYPKNRALVLKIEQVNKIAENYYDVVVFGKVSKTAPLVTRLEAANLKVKILNSEISTYNDIYHINANQAFILENGEEDKITVSSQVKAEYEKSDMDIFSQLGSYAFLKGSLAEFYTAHTPGKMTIHALYNVELSDQIITELVAIIGF